MEVEPVRDINQVKQIYNWLNENYTVREAELWLIGCNIALRAGDLLSLKFDQFEGADKVTIKERKSGMRKDIPITKTVRESVDRLKKYYASKKWYKTKDFVPVYLFQATSRRMYHQCKPVCIQWVSEVFKKAQNELNLGYNFNTHSMRKTWGYHAYNSGEDIAYVQALLNHREQYTTLRYIGATKDYVEKMVVSHQMDMTK